MVTALPDGVTAADFDCQICKSTLQDPFVTACGHSFCHTCVHRHLQQNSSCPSCSAYLSSDHIYPNFLLGKVCRRFQKAERRQELSQVEQIRDLLQGPSAPAKLQELNAILQLVQERKDDMEQRQADNNMGLLLHFLQHSRTHKTQKMQDLQDELHMLESDIAQVAVRQGFGNGLLQGLPAASARPMRSLRDCLLQNGHTAGPGPSRPHGSLGGSQQHPAGQAHMRPSIPGVPAHAQAVLNGPAHQMLLAASAHQRQAQLARAQSPGRLEPGRMRQQQRRPQALTDGTGSAAQPNMQEAERHLPHESSLPAAVGFVRPDAHPSAEPLPLGPATIARRVAQPLQQALEANPGRTELQEAAGGVQDLSQERVGSPEAQTHTPMSSGDLDTEESSRSNGWLTTQHASRAGKRRLVSQFNDLQRCYLRLRNEQLGHGQAGGHQQPSSSLEPPGPSPLPHAKRKRGFEEASDLAASSADMHAHAAEAVQRVGPVGTLGGLHEFARMLSTFTRCSKLKVVAHVPHPNARQTTSILSSIDFDKDARLFATAGVSKRISFYEYEAIAANAASSDHKPCSELVTRSKLSCLAWNAGDAAQLISSDYEGVVTLWDAEAGNALSEYEAHERRIWSIDFCKTDPRLFASGSDDGCVKIWDTNTPNHVGHLPMRANVCCVKFSPTSAHEVAIGSADHHVHLYDLRNPAQAVHVFKGHRKAVSYVRFMSGGRVVSASTDSTLRLWDATGSTPQRTYDGHTNEKNFVGLSVAGDFIACGSETNEVYVYHQAMSKPLAQRLFAPSTANGNAAHDPSQFISAVCWKPRSQLLLAASSTGAVRLMQLTS